MPKILRSSAPPTMPRRSRARLVAGSLTAIAIFAGMVFAARAWLVKSPSAPHSILYHTTPSSLSVNRRELDQRVVRALTSLGDRFEVPGKERVTLSASFTRYRGSAKTTGQATIIRELPNKLRFAEHTSTGAREMGFDGNTFWTSGSNSAPQGADLQLLEFLVWDSIEFFIAGQANGNATRVLGDMFRLDDGRAPGYAGPFYDVLKVDENFTSSTGNSRRPTTYYLNSQTSLPERVVYDHPTKKKTRVIIEFTNWLTAGNQKSPGKATRKENGMTSEEIIIARALFGPKVHDDIFTKPSSVSGDSTRLSKLSETVPSPGRQVDR
jgi:hypothetical protein